MNNDMLDPEELTRQTRAERERLADLLEQLTDEQFSHPSLCEEWLVKDVLAHLTLPYRATPLSVVTGVARAGFSFSRYATQDARRASRKLPADDLLALFRDNVDHPWTPPGAGPAGALSHDVVHGLDITVPLGLPAAPPHRVALVLASMTRRQVRYFGVDLDALRLTATDADISTGTGAAVFRMPVQDILLTVTGRLPLPAPRPAGHLTRNPRSTAVGGSDDDA